MNARQLRDLIARHHGQPISAARLNGWIKQGLPCQGTGRAREFNPVVVREWLVARGLASDAENDEAGRQPLAETQDDAARELGIARRTLCGYLKEGCPGEPGRYPLDEIRDWIARNKGGATAGGQSQAALMAVHAELVKVKLQKELGRLIDAELPGRMLQQICSPICQLLEQIPDRHKARMPDEPPTAEAWLADRQSLDEALRADIADVRSIVAGLFDELAHRLARES